MNWVGRGADLRARRTAEAPTGGGWGGVAYDPNTFVWPSHALNMSYGAPVPAGFSWSVLPFEAATALTRASGALLFASAGNDGLDVDSEDGFIFCWEDTLFTPCENAGVTVVEDPPGNVPPTALTSAPTEGARFIGDQWDPAAERYYAMVTLCGQGIDPEDGAIPSERLVWTGSADDGPVVPLGSPLIAGCVAVRLDRYDLFESFWTLRLTATDSAGDTGQAEVHVSVYGLF